MSGLLYQNRCQGWSSPSAGFGPQIASLTGYYSPAGSTTLVSINGTNFYSYSTISFGTFKPTVYFINSNILQFYVPSTLSSGTFPVQVFNASTGSNSVNYTIDNASGYWMLNSNGSISNTNTSGSGSSLVAISALSRGVPTVLTGILYNNILTPYIVPSNVTWLICNSSATIFITLPQGTQYIGREITIKNANVYYVNSAVPNIIQKDDMTGYTTMILPYIAGAWVTLVFNGTYWIRMQSNFII